MAFDGIVTKAIASELQNLKHAKIDKIHQPNKNTILIGLYLEGMRYLLNICINSQNYRIHLTTHVKTNPSIAPNFCMLLRKHLTGLYIKNITTNNLERLVIIDFEGFDDLDDLVSKRLIVELMGKHCNIILLDEQNIIIDSLRHINTENSLRNIAPHHKYVYPPSNKQNFLDCTSFDNFYKKIFSNNNQPNKQSNNISDIFTGISKSFIDASINTLNISLTNESNYKKLYDYIKKIIYSTDTDSLDFKIINNTKKKDYFLIEADNNNIEPFHLNFFIDDFYYEKETSEDFKNYRDSILKMIFDVLKKYQKKLFNIDEKLDACADMDKYQLYGELITANLYKIKNENVQSIELDNYYTNEKILIPLDSTYTPSINAKRYFKKYRKLKNALNIVTEQKNETLKDLDYIESIIYELEAANTIQEISDIFEEISENIIFKGKSDIYKADTYKKKKEKIKKSSLTKNKTVSFNPFKYKIDNFTLLVGRNNKENDYLTMKYAKKTDIWFHTKDIHGSHAILQLTNNEFPSEEVLKKCCEIVAYHSKAQLSSNVPVDMCEVKYVRKPNGSKPGMVIYSNNTTLYVTPKKA